MRNRMRRRSSSGSMWMSELRSRSAWPTMRLHELDDRGPVVEADLGDRVGGLTGVVLGGERGDEQVDVGGRAVHLLDERRDRLVVRRLPHELLAGDLLDHLAPRRRRVGGVEHDHPALVGDRHHLVLAGDLFREAGDDLLVERRRCSSRRRAHRTPWRRPAPACSGRRRACSARRDRNGADRRWRPPGRSPDHRRRAGRLATSA